jgi:integrase/recombinase XerD
LKNVKKASRSTITLALCGIKFFYERTLQRQWVTLAIVRPQRAKKLTVVLSVEEVRQILSRVRRWRYRVCLSTIYACGLCLQEGLHLQIGHLDSFCSQTESTPAHTQLTHAVGAPRKAWRFFQGESPW